LNDLLDWGDYRKRFVKKNPRIGNYKSKSRKDFILITYSEKRIERESGDFDHR